MQLAWTTPLFRNFYENIPEENLQGAVQAIRNTAEILGVPIRWPIPRRLDSLLPAETQAARRLFRLRDFFFDVSGNFWTLSRECLIA